MKSYDIHSFLPCSSLSIHQVVLTQTTSEAKPSTLIAPVEERQTVEICRDIKQVVEETSRHEEIEVEYLHPERNVVPEGVTQPIQERVTERITSEISGRANIEEITEVLVRPSKQETPQSVVQPAEEMVSEEHTSDMMVIVDEKPQQHEVLMEFAKPIRETPKTSSCATN